MSLIYTCDLCGAMIDREAPYVTLNGNGDRVEGLLATGYVGHYHADPEVGCWNRILETIRLATRRAWTPSPRRRTSRSPPGGASIARWSPTTG